MRHASALIAVLVLCLASFPLQAEESGERIDYLTFAQGAVPVGVQGAGTRLGTSFEEAIRATDGNPAGFSLADKPGPADTDTEFVYKLPPGGPCAGDALQRHLEGQGRAHPAQAGRRGRFGRTRSRCSPRCSKA